MASTSVKCVIGDQNNLVRFSYLHVFEPYAFGECDNPKYSAVILISKKDTKLVESVRAAIKKAYDAAVTEKWGGKKPPIEKATCLFDGDEPKDDGETRGEAYEGMYYLNAKSTQQPCVVDSHCQNILNSEDVYSGCYGRVSVAFSGWTNNGKMGLSCYLNSIQKVKDGEPLGASRNDAKEDFGMFNAYDDDEEM